MAILDINTQLISAISPTSTGTSEPGSVLDAMTQVGTYDWGAGNDWIWYTDITAAFVGATATMRLVLEGSATDPNFGGTIYTILDTGVVAVTTLILGYEFKLKYPRGFPLVRYIRVKQIVATANFTGGTYSSWLMPDQVQDTITAPAGYTILS